MNLTERIRQLCESKGETLASLERKMDFGNGTIRRWAKTSPSSDKLAKVADFFGVTTDYLLNRSLDMTPFDATQPDTGSLQEVYFSLAKDAQDNNIAPADIKAAIDLLKSLKDQQNK